MAEESRAESSAKPHILAIDGLRALAVVAVIVFHISPGLLPGGFAGVDVFFVISGYVVTRSLVGQEMSSLPRFIASFYQRRVARIYPALVAFLLGTGLISNLFIPSSFVADTSYFTGLFAFFGLSNYALIKFNDGYFSPLIEYNSYGHTWSLAVEEQFYFLFPILLFLWLRRGNRSLTSWPSYLIGLLCLGSLGFCAWETRTDLDQAYYLLPSRFWELGAGAFLCLAHRQRLAIPKRSFLAGSVGVGLILVGFLFAKKDLFPFPWALLPVAGAVGLIMASLGERTAVTSFFASKPVVYVGKLSYSLYLWHFPIIVLARWTVGLAGPGPILGVLILTGLLSVASYHLIEPLGKKAFTSGRGRWRAVLGVIGLLACMGAWRLSYKYKPVFSLSRTRDTSVWNPLVIGDGSIVAGPTGKVWSGRKLFVLGDSHALVYSEMLEQLSAETGISIYMFNKNGCAVENLLKPTDSFGQDCVDYVAATIPKVLDEAGPNDMVFLASLRSKRFGDEWSSRDVYEVVKEQASAAEGADRDSAYHEADEVLAKFQAKGVRVLMDAPKPLFPSPTCRCADWYDKMNPICAGGSTLDRSLLESYRAPVVKSLARLKKKYSVLEVWDPFPTLCPGEKCSAYDGDQPLFFDTDHLSGYGNRFLYPAFLARLQRIWPSGT